MLYPLPSYLQELNPGEWLNFDLNQRAQRPRQPRARRLEYALPSEPAQLTDTATTSRA